MFRSKQTHGGASDGLANSGASDRLQDSITQIT